MLLKGSPADFTQPFEELVVVPDGVLWYLPFEALQVTVDGQSQPLDLAIPHSLCADAFALHGRRSRPQCRRATRPWWWANSIRATTTPRRSGVRATCRRSCPALWRSESPPPAPSSIYGTLFHRLVVLRRLGLSDQDPYGWAPAPIDRGKAGASLADWLALPWGGPEVIILPGFHTAAEDALKRIAWACPATKCSSRSAD